MRGVLTDQSGKDCKVAEDLFARSSLVDFINDPFPSAGWSNRGGEGRNQGTKADQLASGT